MKPGEPPKLQIAMLLYPGLTLLDLIGPQTVFSWFADIHLVWKTKDLVISDTPVSAYDRQPHSRTAHRNSTY